MGDTTDETTQGSTYRPKGNDVMEGNPHEVLNPDVVKELGADKDITALNEDAHKLEISPGDARKIWDGVTGGATHKITACMNQMKGKVKDEAAFCQSLATKVGYKPE